jgi:3-isopropylmalate dehydrogenase
LSLQPLFHLSKEGEKMHQYKLGVLNGDGIGPEIVKSTVDVITAAIARVGGSTLEYIPLPMGWEGITKYDAPVPEFTKAELKKCDGWLMGPHDSAAYPSAHLAKLNPSGELRHCFDLFSNVRPARFIPGCKSLVGEDVDLVIMRENTEGFYPDRNMYKGLGEFMPTPDTCIVSGVFTRRAAERIAMEGFTLAMKRRKKVTIVHWRMSSRWHMASSGKPVRKSENNFPRCRWMSITSMP